PEHRSNCRWRTPLQSVSCDALVLTHARLCPDRSEPPRGRHGLPDRHPDRLSGLQRSDPPLGWHLTADLARKGLQHIRGGKVASRATVGTERLGTLRALAARARL